MEDADPFVAKMVQGTSLAADDNFRVRFIREHAPITALKAAGVAAVI